MSNNCQIPRHTLTVPTKLKNKKTSAANIRLTPSSFVQVHFIIGCNENVIPTTIYPIIYEIMSHYISLNRINGFLNRWHDFFVQLCIRGNENSSRPRSKRFENLFIFCVHVCISVCDRHSSDLEFFELIPKTNYFTFVTQEIFGLLLVKFVYKQMIALLTFKFIEFLNSLNWIIVKFFKREAA